MLDPLLEWASGVPGVEISWTTLVVTLLIIVPLSTRFITSVRCVIALRQKGDSRTPPTAPYTIPFVAHTVSFGYDIMNFSTTLRNSFGTSPVRVSVANQNLRLISGSDQVQAFFKASREASTVPNVLRVLEVGFGTSPRLRHLFTRDTTGLYHVPLEGSEPLEPHNRILHNIHKIHHAQMSGTGLADLGSRFMTFLEIELNRLDIGDDWTHIGDLYSLVQKVAFRASITAIFGPHLLRINPTFVEDFWEYDSGIPQLFKDLPRWMIPKTYATRDKLLDGLAKWHKHAEQHFDWDDEKIAQEEWEEFYGSKLTRERTRMYNAIDGMEDSFRCSNDLGLIFGATSNLIPLISWEILDAISRPGLLARCRNEISKTIDPSAECPLGIQTAKLFNNPLLLSIYAEEMRLRVGIWLQRTPITDNYHLGSWKFPKNETIMISAWHEHRDKSVVSITGDAHSYFISPESSVSREWAFKRHASSGMSHEYGLKEQPWNEGPVQGVLHPIEEFWSDRFLVYRHDPVSGPRKPGTDHKSRKAPNSNLGEASGGPKFTTDSVAGSFVPYGGGANICPGRFFAKQEALIGLSLFIMKFDIELVGKVELKPNLRYYPFGMLPPLGKLPARMRRRKQT